VYLYVYIYIHISFARQTYEPKELIILDTSRNPGVGFGVQGLALYSLTLTHSHTHTLSLSHTHTHMHTCTRANTHAAKFFDGIKDERVYYVHTKKVRVASFFFLDFQNLSWRIVQRIFSLESRTNGWIIYVHTQKVRVAKGWGTTQLFHNSFFLVAKGWVITQLWYWNHKKFTLSKNFLIMCTPKRCAWLRYYSTLVKHSKKVCAHQKGARGLGITQLL
jgi:hypothetical protein